MRQLAPGNRRHPPTARGHSSTQRNLTHRGQHSHTAVGWPAPTSPHYHPTARDHHSTNHRIHHPHTAVGWRAATNTHHSLQLGPTAAPTAHMHWHTIPIQLGARSFPVATLSGQRCCNWSIFTGPPPPHHQRAPTPRDNTGSSSSASSWGCSHSQHPSGQWPSLQQHSAARCRLPQSRCTYQLSHCSTAGRDSAVRPDITQRSNLPCEVWYGGMPSPLPTLGSPLPSPSFISYFDTYTRLTVCMGRIGPCSVLL